MKVSIKLWLFPDGDVIGTSDVRDTVEEPVVAAVVVCTGFVCCGELRAVNSNPKSGRDKSESELSDSNVGN